MKISVQSLNKSYAAIVLVMFILNKPDSLKYIGLDIFETLIIILNFVVAICCVLAINNYKISKLSIMIITMYFIMTISTFVNKGDYSWLIKTIGPSSVLCLVTDYYMQLCPERFIKANLILWITLYGINFISIILYPNGMYTTDRMTESCWIMGYDNGYIYHLIPLVGYSLIYSYMKYLNAFSWITVVTFTLLTATVLATWSATGIAMTVFFVLLLFLERLPLLQKIIRPNVLIGLFVILTVLVVGFRMISLFEPLIVDILHKDVTFSGRIYMWDYVISKIKEKWFIGYGQVGYGVITRFGSYLHPHCLLLDMLYKGGILMLGIFLYILHSFSKCIEKFWEEPCSKIILAVVGTILMGEIVNSAQYKPLFWSYIVLAAYVPLIAGKNKEIEKNNFIRFKYKC